MQYISSDIGKHCSSIERVHTVITAPFTSPTSLGILRTSSVSIFVPETQVPCCCLVKITHSPTSKPVTPLPTCVTWARPSFPAMKTGLLGLPLPELAKVVLGIEFTGYTPSITLTSAGLMGERRNLTFRVFAGGGGNEGYVRDVRTEVGLPFCS
jgi:hypothetical protein